MMSLLLSQFLVIVCVSHYCNANLSHGDFVSYSGLAQTENDSKIMEASDKINHYKYIPLHNERIVSITNLADLDLPERISKTEIFQRVILQKRKPIIEDLRTVQTKELQLLKLGRYATCRWKYPLPPPLDEDEQCSATELQNIIDYIIAQTTVQPQQT